MTADVVPDLTGVVMTREQFLARRGPTESGAEEWAETPTEIALVTGDTSALDTASREAAALMVTKALQESRQWLAVAMQGTDPTPIAEFKAWAATIEEATKQKNLGREIELDAAEMVRRAERGIGVAIRNGQKAGEIAKPYDNVRQGQGALSKSALPPSPTDYATSAELSANGAGIYHLTDGVTDEQFDAAVAEAKAEGNLSRANVVRKAKGEQPKPAGRHELLRKTRHHDSNRIVEQTVIGLEGLVLGVALIDFDALDRQQIAAWSSSLATSLQSLNRLSRRLKELDQA